MKYLVAVSGGVDSVVLIDMLAREGVHELTVAHFEHGIRGEESLGDQQFVRELAENYGLEFVTMNAQLGAHVSEANARAARYTFLENEAKKRGATIVTAHHADDIVETIAINLTRGTGWRGLAVIDSRDIYRPLLHMTKQEIIAYANKNNLEWREDSTNTTDAYLRNRLRKKLADASEDTKNQLLALRDVQVALKHEIDSILMSSIETPAKLERKIFSVIDDSIADEVLRTCCVQLFGVAPPRPARARIIEAIRTYSPAKVHQSTDRIDVAVDKHYAYLKIRA